MNIHGLYVIADTAAMTEAELMGNVALAIRGGAQAVQYRDKDHDPDGRYRMAFGLARLCERHRVPFIINDDAALAVSVNADGVHLGRDDMSLSQARQLVGNDRLIGVSCYDDVHRALELAAQGADYVAFGSFFPSPSKPGTVPASPAVLRQARKQLNIPIVAIGGITPDNGAQLLAAGADALAVISGVFSRTDIPAAARQFAQLFDSRANAGAVTIP